MSTLTVWAFDNVTGAETAQEALKALAQQNKIALQDAAAVSWEYGDKKPHVHRLEHLTGKGALKGSVVGFLIGALFLVPVLGVAAGAGIGALRGKGKSRAAGMDDDVLRQIKEQVVPGTSALFLLSSDADVESVRPLVRSLQPKLIRTNLDPDQEQELRTLAEGSETTSESSTPA
jgi:uncharacterized membrane protein